MARPTKYDETRAKKICDLLRSGGTRKAAAGSAGVEYLTFLRWLGRYDSFVTDVSRAESDAESICAATFQKAALAGDWKAAESWLKRRRREEWGDNISLTTKNDDDLLNEAEAIVERQRASRSSGSDTPGANALTDTDEETLQPA